MFTGGVFCEHAISHEKRKQQKIKKHAFSFKGSVATTQRGRRKKHGEKMSTFQAAYALTALASFVLGIGFSFIDGMLLWAVLFFAFGVLVVLMRIMWSIAGWADNVARNLGDDSRY